MSAITTTSVIEHHRTHRWAVLNCSVTQILDLCASEQEAQAVAAHHGNCSFPYHLSEEETRALIDIELSPRPCTAEA